MITKWPNSKARHRTPSSHTLKPRSLCCRTTKALSKRVQQWNPGTLCSCHSMRASLWTPFSSGYLTHIWFTKTAATAGFCWLSLDIMCKFSALKCLKTTRPLFHTLTCVLTSSLLFFRDFVQSNSAFPLVACHYNLHERVREWGGKLATQLTLCNICLHRLDRLSLAMMAD